MDDLEMTFDPVGIALTRIEAGPTVRFIGTDVETGAAVTIVVETPELGVATGPGPIYEAAGLILKLTIEMQPAG